MSTADDFLTPMIIADAFAEFGGVGLDPATNWYSQVPADVYYMTRRNYETPRPEWSIIGPNDNVHVVDADAGGAYPFDESWAGHGLVFCNGPYSRVSSWSCKAKEADECVLLLPVMTSESWWHRDIVGRDPAAAVLFWEGRLSFLEYDPSIGQVRKAKHNARFSSALAYYGPNPALFADVFTGCGWCVAPKYVDVARL